MRRHAGSLVVTSRNWSDKRLLREKTSSRYTAIAMWSHQAHSSRAKGCFGTRQDWKTHRWIRMGRNERMVHEADLVLKSLLSLLGSRTYNSIDWADRRDIVFVTHSFLKESIADLPCKNARILLLVLLNLGDNIGGSDLWLAPTNDSWLYRPRLIVSGKTMVDMLWWDLVDEDSSHAPGDKGSPHTA